MIWKERFSFKLIIIRIHQVLPWWLSSKESACNAGATGDVDSPPGSGRFPWRRAWQPTPVFLPEESHGQRNLEGYSPQGHKESDTTERLHFVTAQCLIQSCVCVCVCVCESKSVMYNSLRLHGLYSLPSSSVHGILQARILVWVAHSLLQRILSTQGLNPGLLHCRRIL